MRNKLPLAHFSRVAMLAIVASFCLEGAPVEQRLWREIGRYLQGKVVTIMTKDGRSLSARRFTIQPDGIFLNDGTPMRVSRDAVLSIHWEAPRQSETHKLGKSLSTGYRHSGKLLGTQLGPVALAELPLITAYGVAAAPFCLLGDLFGGHPAASGDISILPEPGVTK